MSGTEQAAGRDVNGGARRVIDTSVAHSARVHDYWLGGKDNFAADRAAGDAVLQAYPGIVASVRSRAAAAVSAVSLPKATSRGRYFMPQSGASTWRSGGTYGSARRTRASTVSGDSTVRSFRSSTPKMMVLPSSAVSTEQSRPDWAVSMEIWSQLQSASSG